VSSAVKCDIKWLELLVADRVREGEPYYCAEVGLYKPWCMSVLNAAKRRGYRVERKMAGVYFVYPKGVSK
jgi:hypothetical protein